ncbi:MAG: hypothetical protein K2P58_12160 [Hyphomonadaceae bacterium]|nr:hypothetical protein [Hyphomonadaceae bacterium]
MIRRTLAAASAALFAPCAAMAQPLFDNPLAEASVYLLQRGQPSEATYRLRYEVTRVERGEDPITSELTLDIGPDWSVWRDGTLTVLLDFRLNRTFVLDHDRFTTVNGAADLTFRVMERLNRSHLQGILTAAGAGGQLPNACDAETELGLVIPSANASPTSVRSRRNRVVLQCAGRDVGSYAPSDSAPPPAFWPTMNAIMLVHPALYRHARSSGRAPSELTASFQVMPGPRSSRSWRLIAIEEVAVAYPLTSHLRNETARGLDQLVPGAGQAATDVIAGRAPGGTLTLESWDRHMQAISQSQGEAAAAMLFSVTFNMFPDLRCDGPAQLHACDLLARVRTMSDPAPWAIIEIGIAEQEDNVPRAIEAMQRAQGSPHRDHPALGAAFALAVLQFDQAALDRARGAGLPTDVPSLQNQALLALPYNPGYWTDVGDRFARDYDFRAAFLFYDIAFSLPLPSALTRNQALAAKRANAARIRRDFPDAFLTPTP